MIWVYNKKKIWITLRSTLWLQSLNERFYLIYFRTKFVQIIRYECKLIAFVQRFFFQIKEK